MDFQLSCPAPSEWRQILDKESADSFVKDWAAHLEECPFCQAAVGDLLTDAWPDTSADPRPELPPAPPKRQLLDRLNQETPAPTGTSGVFALQPQADPGIRPLPELRATRVYCPHCFELVYLKGDVAAGRARCPNCTRVVDATSPEETVLPDYDVATRENIQERDVRAYVHSLEERARIEDAQVPYRRGRFPVEVISGLLLMGGGCFLFSLAFTGVLGWLFSLIFLILPAFALFLIGALFLTFRPK